MHERVKQHLISDIFTYLNDTQGRAKNIEANLD